MTGLLLFISFHTANAQTPEASPPSGQVFFYYHAADLNQKGRETLEEWAQFLLTNPQARLQVKGHSCHTAKRPEELALARAQAVADFCKERHFRP
ncbi:MAG: OmpA family protein [Microscillaceae bacterium]|nr:OmpA family protein [Microscillaceae bacterium]